MRALFEESHSLREAVFQIIEAYQKARRTVREMERDAGPGRAVAAICREAKEDLESIVPGNFLEVYSLDRLTDLPRYLAALQVRLERGKVDPAKDRKKTDRVRPFAEAVVRIKRDVSPETSVERKKAIEGYRWMAEEFKVSLYAPEMKTAFSVSPKRLAVKLKEIEALGQARSLRCSGDDLFTGSPRFPSPSARALTLRLLVMTFFPPISDTPIIIENRRAFDYNQWKDQANPLKTIRSPGGQVMKTEHYNRVKDQIGHCGIWCGSCVVGNGTLREITSRYREIIKNYDLESWAPKTFDFKEFLKGLETIGTLPLCQGCQKGGGWEGCPMRGCVSKKKIADCTECDQPESCPHIESLQKMRSGSLRAGLFVKTENVGRAKLLKEWDKKIKTHWPSSLLFLDDE